MELLEEESKNRLIIMVAKSKNKENNWEELVSSLGKRLNEEKKISKEERLTAVEVICSQEDIDRTRQSWKKEKHK